MERVDKIKKKQIKKKCHYIFSKGFTQNQHISKEKKTWLFGLIFFQQQKI